MWTVSSSSDRVKIMSPPLLIESGCSTSSRRRCYCRPSLAPSYLLNLAFLLLLFLLPTSHAEDQSSKRGICYLDSHHSDNALLMSTRSPLAWYYNWSPYPSSPVDNGPWEFTPLIHGLADAASSDILSAINDLPSSSTHLLTFNEPDGTTQSGGSDISPQDAARSYIDNIVPLRSGSGGGRTWNISQPSVTGSGRGLDWLRAFNASCYAIDPERGCPADFIAAHWYGDFAGLASWLGTLDQFYNGDGNSNSNGEAKLRIWITEMALPQASASATVAMMNTTLPYLDGLAYVEKYAWFGAFRSDDANEWTGDGVALFNPQGGLTQLGSLYLGGEGNGFAVGEQGPGAENGAASLGSRGGHGRGWLWVWLMMLGVVIFCGI